MAKDSGDLLPIVGVDRELVEHYNKGKAIKGFDGVGYFMFEGVVVCEKGKEEQIKQQIEDTSTQDNFTLRQNKK